MSSLAYVRWRNPTVIPRYTHFLMDMGMFRLKDNFLINTISFKCTILFSYGDGEDEGAGAVGGAESKPRILLMGLRR